MKNLKIIVLVLMGTPLLLGAYADVHTTKSVVPAVDIYKYYASNEQDAMRMHKDYVKALGIPDNVAQTLDKIKVITKPIAFAAGGASGGVTIALQAGFDIAVDVFQQAQDLFGRQLFNEAIGRAFRGDEHAFHPNVPRGNRGRFAEWNTDRVMYAIVTLPGSLIPLHKFASREAPGDITNITVVLKDDIQNPGSKVYEVSFGGVEKNEFLPAEQDKRNRAHIRDAAKESGLKAANLLGAPQI